MKTYFLGSNYIIFNMFIVAYIYSHLISLAFASDNVFIEWKDVNIK